MKSLNVKLASQKGFGLLEIGLALLVVAVLGIYAYGQYADSRDETVSSAEVSDMTLYWAKTQQRYSSNPSYAGLTTAGLIGANVFPHSMDLVPGTSVVNKYQGTVAAAAVTLTTAGDGVEFTMSGYPQNGCASVVPKVANGARKIDVNGTIVKPLDGALNVTGLGTACLASSANVIKFSIGR
jgi:type II secretory pathway pseudopilin PulG